MCIQLWFHICKWRILLFENHLDSGLTKIDPKTIRIWSKWEKECHDVTSAREPTCISQMGIKKLFWPEVEKKGPKNYTSPLLAIRTTCTTPKWVSKYDFTFANGYIFFSIITFIRGLPESTRKRYEFDRNGKNNDSTLRALGNPLASLKWVSKNWFVILNP